MLICHCCNQEVKADNDSFKGMLIVQRNRTMAHLHEANETLNVLQTTKVQANKQNEHQKKLEEVKERLAKLTVNLQSLEDLFK